MSERRRTKPITPITEEELEAMGLTREGRRFFTASEGDVIEFSRLNFKHEVLARYATDGMVAVLTMDEWRDPKASGAKKATHYSVRVADCQGAQSWGGLEREIAERLFKTAVDGGIEAVERLRRKLVWSNWRE